MSQDFNFVAPVILSLFQAAASGQANPFFRSIHSSISMLTLLNARNKQKVGLEDSGKVYRQASRTFIRLLGSLRSPKVEIKPLNCFRSSAAFFEAKNQRKEMTPQPLNRECALLQIFLYPPCV